MGLDNCVESPAIQTPGLTKVSGTARGIEVVVAAAATFERRDIAV